MIDKLSSKYLCLLAGICLGISLFNMASAQDLQMALRNPSRGASSAIRSSEVKNWKDGAEFIASISRTAEELSQYSFQYSMTAYKGKGAVKETGDFYFKKPKLMRVEVKTGAKKGAVAILAADGKVHGHLGGWLKFLKGTVSTNSEYAKTANGYPMADSDFASLYAYLKNMLSTGFSSRVSTEPVQVGGLSQKVYVLEMIKPRPTGDLLVKRIFVDGQSLLPVMWEDYTGGRLDTLSSWQNVNTKITLDNSKFQI